VKDRAPHEVLLEFKQQPREKYIYRISDFVEYAVKMSDGKTVAYQHAQEQKSELLIKSIDSAMVHSLNLSFLVTQDSLINAPEQVHKRRRLSAGDIIFFQLKMRQNGEVIDVQSDNPSVTFFYNTGYKPSQPVFPDRAIVLGHSWTQNFEIEVPYTDPAVVTTEYKLNSFAKLDRFDCAVIDFKGELEYDQVFKSPDKNDASKFIVRKSKTKITSEGQIFFAYHEGFMVKKTNMITSTYHAKIFTNDEIKEERQTVTKDRESITLLAVHRPDGKVMKYNIP